MSVHAASIRCTLARCLAVMAFTAVSGCGGSLPVASTNVGQEELFRTGDFNYDEYFEDVHGLQANAHHATEEEKRAREPLARALAIGDASLDRLLDQLKSVVDAQAQTKSRVHFTMSGVDERGTPLPGRPIMVTAAAGKGRALPKDAAELTIAIDQTAKAEGQVWEKYAPLPEKGRRLSEKAGALASDVKTTFAAEPKAKREQIERELSVAKVATKDIAERCDKVVKAATTFFKRSQEVFASAANTEITPPAKASPKNKTGAPRANGKARDDKPRPAKPAQRKAGKPAGGSGSEGEGANSGEFNP